MKNNNYYFYKKVMSFQIEIDPRASRPKYLQIVDSVMGLQAARKLKKGQRLPPINTLSSQLGVGRVTVVNAYKELQRLGIVEAVHGKGYFIKDDRKKQVKKVFLLFDAMNGYKEVLYRSFVQALGKKYRVSIFFFYYNYQEFCRIIDANLGLFDFYVILPHFNTDISGPLRPISREKLFLMDKDAAGLGEGYAAVFQDFHNDTYQALMEGREKFMKYGKINLVLQESFQFIPDGIITGFEAFCQETGMNHALIKNLIPERIVRGEVYFVISDIDLISVVKFVKENQLQLGKDIGLISFDDTPLKTVLANGITTISTDFNLMGKTTAALIRKGTYKRIANPSRLIIRGSL